MLGINWRKKKAFIIYIAEQIGWMHMIVSIIVIKPNAQYISLGIAFEGNFLVQEAEVLLVIFELDMNWHQKVSRNVHTCIFISLYRSKEWVNMPDW